MEIKVEGLDALMRKLGTMEKIESELTPWAERTLRMAKAGTDYTQSSPPRLPGQRYVRTFALMAGWRDAIQVSMGAITARRYNDRTPYGAFVMGRTAQAGMHRGRWPTDAGIEQRIAPAAIEDLNRTIQRIIDN